MASFDEMDMLFGIRNIEEQENGIHFRQTQRWEMITLFTVG